MGQLLDVYVHTLNIYMNAEDTRHQLNMATEQRERIFSASPVAMIMYDSQHQVVMSNDKAKEMTQLMERRQGPRKCIHAFCEGKTPDECPVRQAFASGKTIVTTEKYGGRMYSVSTVPIYDNGIVVNVMQTFTDQTALVNSERHFKKTSELLSGILSTMPCAAFIKECGDQIRYLLASDYLENAMNWEKGHVKGKTSRELFGEMADAFEESDRLTQEKGSWSGMIALKTPNKEMNLFCVKRHIKDPDGHDMIIGVELDMTENIKQRRSLEITHEALQDLPLQKDALACLPPMLAKLSALLDASSHVIINYDGDQTVSPNFWSQDGQVNPSSALLDAMGRLRNYEAPEPLLKIYGVEGVVAVAASPLDAAMKAVGAQSIVCVPVFHEAMLWGRLCFFRKTAELFSQVDCFIVQDVGKIIELALRRSSVLDELAAKERRLHVALVDAKEAASARGEFLTTMGHEIRTPLNSIIGIANCMDVKDLSLEQAHEYAQDIKQPANALMVLLDDILELSNISSGRLDVRMGECNVVALFDKLKAEFEPKANAGVKLLAHIDPKEFPVLKLNDHCVRQLLGRMIGNALKFTESGEVSFAASFKPTSTTSGTLELEVKDSGCGIDDVMQKIMFDPFVHHEKHDQSIAAGTGLGLPIVKAIVEKLDGDVTVDSAEGQGSSFHIRIPRVDLASAVVAKTAEKPTVEQPVLPKGLRVLVVDDVPLNLKITSKYLERFGAECRISTDPNEALALLKNYKVDLVLTDLWMPGMNGMEMVKAIHLMPGLDKLPVVAVTADIEVKNDPEENELVDILHKPITPESLRNVLVKCICA